MSEAAEADLMLDLKHVYEHMVQAPNERLKRMVQWAWFEGCEDLLRQRPKIGSGEEWDNRRRK